MDQETQGPARLVVDAPRVVTGLDVVPGAPPGIDFGAVFDALPTPYLVLDTDLRIVAVNRAREVITGRERGDVVGQPLFDAFPDDPDDPEADGVANLRASLRRVLRSGRSESMPVQRYDIPAPGGGFLPRWWTPVNTPVLDAAGRVELVLHRVDDVTAYVEEHLRAAPDADPGAAPTTAPAVGSALRTARVDLQVSRQQLQVAREAEATSQRSAALVDVARALGQTETESDVLGVVAARVLVLFGASAPTLCLVEDGDRVRTLTSEQTDAGPRTRLGHLPSTSPLPMVQCARDGAAQFSTHPHRTTDGASAVPEEFRARGSVPLVAREQLLGSLSLGFTHAREWPQSDRDLLGAFAALTAQALARIGSHDREIAAAAQVATFSETLQRSLLTSPPESDDLHVAVRYSPATDDAEVGGDWYDAFTTADGSTSLVVGDVAGHDRVAAAAMGQLRNLLRGIEYTLADPPATVLTTLDHAAHDLAVDTTATLVLARVEQTPQQRREGVRSFRWSNAGHPPPLLIGPDGSVVLLETTPDLMLGVDPATTRHDHEVLLAPGSTVLLYTDGLIERRGSTLQAGLDRLRAAVTDLARLPVDDLCDRLLALVGDQAEDDVALLAVRAARADAAPADVTGRGPDLRRGPSPPEAEPAAGAADRRGRRDRVRSTTTVLDPDPSEVRRARALVHDFCCRAPGCTDVCDTLTLLVSEVVTNAISHGRSQARLRVSATAATVRVEVSDDDSRPPVLTPAGPDALGGRGLAMVDVLATAWGVRRDPVGKTVWIEVRAG